LFFSRKLSITIRLVCSAAHGFSLRHFSVTGWRELLPRVVSYLRTSIASTPPPQMPPSLSRGGWRPPSELVLFDSLPLFTPPLNTPAAALQQTTPTPTAHMKQQTTKAPTNPHQTPPKQKPHRAHNEEAKHKPKKNTPQQHPRPKQQTHHNVPTQINKSPHTPPKKKKNTKEHRPNPQRPAARLGGVNPSGLSVTDRAFGKLPQ